MAPRWPVDADCYSCKLVRLANLSLPRSVVLAVDVVAPFPAAEMIRWTVTVATMMTLTKRCMMEVESS